MRYSVSNVVNKSLDEVVAKYEDPNGMFEWMEGLKKVELLSGEQGEVGAKTKLVFEHKGKEMELEETILEKEMPSRMKFAFVSSMGYSETEIVLEKVSDTSVKQINNSYFELKGFMKIMGPLMKGMFKKQSLKYLNNFKEWAEKA